MKPNPGQDEQDRNHLPLPGPHTSVDVAEILCARPSQPAESYQANGTQTFVHIAAEPAKPRPPGPGHFLPLRWGGAEITDLCGFGGYSALHKTHCFIFKEILI